MAAALCALSVQLQLCMCCAAARRCVLTVRLTPASPPCHAATQSHRNAHSQRVGVLAASDANGGTEDGGSGGGGGGKRHVFGSEGLAFRRAGMEVATPFGADGLVEDWDLAAELLGYSLR